MIPPALVVALFALRACLVTNPLDNLRVVPATEADPNDPPGAIARTGSLYIARGGPVIIGYESPGIARLIVGQLGRAPSDPTSGKVLVSAGLNKDRIILPAGPIAIRFAAPPGARLLWNPVGRRGDLEYLPASSLSPEPPERASFGAFAGTSPLDGIIASLLVLTIVGTVLMLARRRLREVPRETWIAMGAVFLVACVVRWLGLFAFGQTWDEDVNWVAGRNYITNVLARDLSPVSWIWNFEHPPVMKYLAGIGAQFADGYGPARALSAVWIALGCAFLVPIGARLYPGPSPTGFCRLRVGILAAAIAALLPPLVAHGQIVGHEAPTVLWWSLGILLALTVHDGEPSLRTLRIRLVALGVVIGIALASRFVNGLLGVLCLIIVTELTPGDRAPRTLRVHLVWAAVIGGITVASAFDKRLLAVLGLLLVAHRVRNRRSLRTAIEGALIMPVVALVTLYAVWPRLWAHPILYLKLSLAKLSMPHSPEPFLGDLTNLPGAHYFILYLVVTLPLAILLGVVAYLARAGRERDRSALVLAFWFVIPLAVMASPVRQDGVRYVMPCILALALASAAGWDFVVRWVSPRLPRIRRQFLLVTAALTLYLATTLVLVHPYYLDYFGEHVGGAGTVAKKRMFETAWWGEGVDRAVDYVNQHAAPNARVYRNCIEPAHLAWFRYDLWAPMTNATSQADWLVTYSPQSRTCVVPKDMKRVFAVHAQGATLAEVWRR
ncbi:MAG TPA: hypothetical protein VIV11_24850 [Kofleriaceae bacterium]